MKITLKYCDACREKLALAAYVISSCMKRTDMSLVLGYPKVTYIGVPRKITQSQSGMKVICPFSLSFLLSSIPNSVIIILLHDHVRYNTRDVFRES